MNNNQAETGNKDPLDELTKAEFNDWKQNKVTRAIFNKIKWDRQGLLEAIAQGKTIAKDATMSTDYVVGWARGLTEVLLTDVEETAEEKRAKYGY